MVWGGRPPLHILTFKCSDEVRRRWAATMGVAPSVKAPTTFQKGPRIGRGEDEDKEVMVTVDDNGHVRDLQAALFPICNKGSGGKFGRKCRKFLMRFECLFDVWLFGNFQSIRLGVEIAIDLKKKDQYNFSLFISRCLY